MNSKHKHNSKKHIIYLCQSLGHTYQQVLHMSPPAVLQRYSHLALDVPLHPQIHLAPIGTKFIKSIIERCKNFEVASGQTLVYFTNICCSGQRKTQALVLKCCQRQHLFHKLLLTEFNPITQHRLIFKTSVRNFVL